MVCESSRSFLFDLSIEVWQWRKCSHKATWYGLLRRPLTFIHLRTLLSFDFYRALFLMTSEPGLRRPSSHCTRPLVLWTWSYLWLHSYNPWSINIIWVLFSIWGLGHLGITLNVYTVCMKIKVWGGYSEAKTQDGQWPWQFVLFYRVCISVELFSLSLSRCLHSPMLSEEVCLSWAPGIGKLGIKLLDESRRQVHYNMPFSLGLYTWAVCFLQGLSVLPCHSPRDLGYPHHPALDLPHPPKCSGSAPTVNPHASQMHLPNDTNIFPD